MSRNLRQRKSGKTEGKNISRNGIPQKFSKSNSAKKSQQSLKTINRSLYAHSMVGC